MKTQTIPSLILMSMIATALPAFSDDDHGAAKDRVTSATHTAAPQNEKSVVTAKAAILLENNEPIRFKNNAGAIDGTEIRRSGSNAFRFRYRSIAIFDALNNDAFQIRDPVGAAVFSVDPDSHAYFNNSGNVGIGTRNPTERLEVIGNIKLSGNIVSNGDICIGSGCP